MELVIKNGTLVTATDTYQADLRIANEKIVQIGQDLGPEPDARVLDATGKLVFPGGVDPHTHLESTSQGTTTADDYLTGTIAAACGGTTSIVNFCFQEKGKSLDDSLSYFTVSARDKAAIDYGFHAMICDLTDAVLDEIATLPARGVTSIKLFMAYRGCADGRRPDHSANADGGQTERHPGHGPRRERRCRGHAAAAIHDQRQHRAEVPRAESTSTSRGRSDGSSERAGRTGRRADLLRPRQLRRSGRRDPAGAGARGEGDGRDVHPLPVLQRRGSRSTELRRRQVGLHAAAARQTHASADVAGAAAAGASASSRRTTARTTSTARRTWARTISPGSRTAPRASRSA